MSDKLHGVIVKMRDELKSSLSEFINETLNTRFAILESKVRDTVVSAETSPSQVTKNDMLHLKDELVNIILSMNKRDTGVNQALFEPKPTISNNLIIERKVDTGFTYERALKVNAELNKQREKIIEEQHKKVMEKLVEPEEVEPEEVESEGEVEEAEEAEESEEEEEEVEEEAESEAPKFTPLEVGDETYWLDEANAVYKETEEGYEEIGSYDPDTGELNIEEGEGEEVEAEDEEIETIEFTFKGKTYLRDEENNVYNEEGEEVGKWTGTAIKFPITRKI